MDVSVRWMRREDIKKVSSIRRRCGMDSDSLDRMLHDSFSICKVAESEGKVLGFLAYRNGRKKIRLLEVSVDPSFRRQGVGISMLRSVSSRVNFDMKKLEAFVSEYNLPTQMLLKSAGFLAVETVRSASGSEYRFVMSANKERDLSLSRAPKVVEN